VGGPRLAEEVRTIQSAVGATQTSVNLSPNYGSHSPYPSTYVSRAFTVAWEAALPGTTRSSGTLDTPAMAGSPQVALDDVALIFAAKGVLSGDLVVLPGWHRRHRLRPTGLLHMPSADRRRRGAVPVQDRITN